MQNSFFLVGKFFFQNSKIVPKFQKNPRWHSCSTCFFSKRQQFRMISFGEYERSHNIVTLVFSLLTTLTVTIPCLSGCDFWRTTPRSDTYLL